MKKKMTAVFMLFLMIFSLYVQFPTPNVYGYQNSAYYNPIRIGLKSMALPSLSVTLNDSYVVNGQVLPPLSVYTLTVQNGRVLFNGAEYDSITFTPQSQTATLAISSGSKKYKYLGTMAFKVISGSVFPINTVHIEDYLKGVVSYEMSDYFPLEALKSQAVAARNYTLANLGAYNASGYDLTDTIECQVYGGYSESFKNSIRAVEETRGQVQLYNGALVEAYYSASNGGYTEASENVWFAAFPYLRAKKDDLESENWPNGNVIMTNAQIDTTLKNKKYLLPTDVFLRLDFASITRFPSGRVASIDAVYANEYGIEKRKTFTKDRARTFLSLPSALYNVVYDSALGIYTFSGKGYGHGVGLSQMGAKYRAAAGHKYDQILRFYYEGSYTQSLTPKISSFTANANEVAPGKTIQLSAQAQYGSGTGWLFKYDIYKDGVLIYTRDYSTMGSMTYMPSAAGRYDVTVYVKDNLSKTVFDDKANLSVAVYSPPQIGSISVTGPLYENRPVTVGIETSGGSSKGVAYKFEVFKSEALISSRSYTSEGGFQFTPAEYGSYTVKAYVKDLLSENAYDSIKEIPVTIQREPRIDSFSVDKTATLEGQSVMLNTSGRDGSGTGYLYEYVVAKGNEVIYTRPFSEDSSFSYTPVASGDYVASVYLKDKMGDKAYDDQGALSFTVYDTPKIDLSIVAGTLYEKEPVSANVTASGGSGVGLSYRYALYKDGVLLNTKGFSADTVYNFTPSTYGNYVLKAYVKDGISVKEYDNMTEIGIRILRKPITVSTLPLYWGMRGADVIEIQKGLTDLGYPVGVIDGVFGGKTHNAVMSFQSSRGLTASGTVDQVTLDWMNLEIKDL